MKIRIIKCILAGLISILIAYGLSSIRNESNDIAIGVGSFVLIFLTLSTAISIDFDSPRTTLNARVLAMVFFALSLLSNLIFVFINFSVHSYVVVNGLILLLFLLAVYSVYKAGQ